LFVKFDLDVDGTGSVLIKREERQYFEQTYTREQMRMRAEDISDLIIRQTEAYYTGWGHKRRIKQMTEMAVEYQYQ
jgi:hypothetical protein